MAVPRVDRRRALDALAELTTTVGTHLTNPDPTRRAAPHADRWGPNITARDGFRRSASTVTAYGRLLDAAVAQAADDPAAVAVLTQFRAAPAVSAAWLRERIPHDPRPALDRLRGAGILTDHPRLPGALILPQLIELLDAPYRPDPCLRG
ncbi:hypothetical protein [Kitasatospora sp. NPDC090091]|uniref:hypothetical protein n=1 Tax=Kitasatospora sp. NPDC090091 TaxID=3364081 RepID=UPI0037FA6DAD